jgi:hypothetical protein
MRKTRIIARGRGGSLLGAVKSAYAPVEGASSHDLVTAGDPLRTLERPIMKMQIAKKSQTLNLKLSIANNSQFTTIDQNRES